MDDEGIQMNSSAIVISIIGICSSVISCVLNAMLLKKLMRKKRDMVLFTYRFASDVILGILVAISLSCTTLYCLFPNDLEVLHTFIFYFSLPSSNVGAARSIITLANALERSIAAYFPIFYHNHREKVPNTIVLISAIIFGGFEDVVLYGICRFQLKMSENCAAFGCAINSCFFGYWTTHKSIIFASMFFLAIILSVKLFILNRFSNKKNSDLSRANCMALIDAGNVCIFDFLPSFLANQWAAKSPFFSFHNIGPYGAVMKLLGCAIEAALVWKTFARKEESTIHESTSRPRSTVFVGKKL